MKILHVETGRHFLGGPQQVVYLINALRERGHDNTLVCPPDSGIDGVARMAGIRVQNLFCAGDLDLPFAYRLSQFFKEQKPDLVHCHSRRGADLLGGLAASYADIAAVVSRRVDNTEMRLMATLRYRPFQKIIAISEAIAQMLREHDVEEERIAVIRSAVDSEAFAAEPDYDKFREEFGIDELSGGEVKLGFLPPYAAIRLPLLVGPAKAIEVCTSGRIYTADEAQAMGFVSQSVEDDEFTESVVRFIHQIQASSPLILRLNKRAVNQHLGMNAKDALDGVSDLFLNTLMKTEDTLEGIASFYEKRRPDWKNC